MELSYQKYSERMLGQPRLFNFSLLMLKSKYLTNDRYNHVGIEEMLLLKGDLGDEKRS